MVWGLAREGLDDVADPVGKLSQDLLRFVLRRRVHTRLSAFITRKQWHQNKCDFKTVNEQIAYWGVFPGETADVMSIPNRNRLDRCVFRTNYAGSASERGTPRRRVRLL